MPKIQGHILTDDIVVNYIDKDRDDCLHFVTHLDSSIKELNECISPTAKRIYTSHFNAWYLRTNFDVKHIDVQGFDANKSYKMTYKGNKYIYSFLDSKFTTGSVALLLHGPFGTYLYTGNFSYYPSFVRSPVLLPVIEEKALTRLYLDNTYYEQPSNFLSFDELANEAVKLIRSQPKKNIYIYGDKITMDPLIAEIASRLEEKVYVCQGTMDVMTEIGYGSFFTRNSYESRIFVDKAFVKKRGYEDDNIIIQLNRNPEKCKTFRKIERKGNVWNFYFYCHSNHKDICELLTILKPESMTFLFSEIDCSKISYKLNLKNNKPKLFKSFTDKSSCHSQSNEEEEMTLYQTHFNKSSGNSFNNTTNGCKEFVKVIEMNVQTATENQDFNINNLPKENKCPLRIRNVPEINKTGLLSDSDSLVDDDSIQNIKSFNEELIITSSFNNKNILLNDESSTNTNPANNNLVASHLIAENLHNYCKPKQTNNSSLKVVNFAPLASINLSGTNAVSRAAKPFSKCVVKRQIGLPLVIDRKLVKDDTIKQYNNPTTTQNSKLVRISKVGIISTDKKNTILLNKEYLDPKKPFLVEIPGYGSHNKREINCTEDEKDLIQKKPVTLMSKIKITDSHSNNKKRYSALCQPPSNVLNMSSLFQGWMENKSVTGIKKSPTHNINYNGMAPTVDDSENFIIIQSGDSDKDIYQSEQSFETNLALGDRNTFNSVIDIPEAENNSGLIREINTDVLLNDDDRVTIQNNDDTTLTIATKSQSSLVCDTSESIYKITTKAVESGKIEIEPTFMSDKSHNELEKGYEHNSLKDSRKSSSKRTFFFSESENESSTSRKKLRSDNLRPGLGLPNLNNTDGIKINESYVLLRKNDVEKTYFYSAPHHSFLPKFCGFKKHEIRPRHHLICLRSIKKYIEKL